VNEAGKVKEFSFVEEGERVDHNCLLDVAGCCTYKKPSRPITSGLSAKYKLIREGVEQKSGKGRRHAKGNFGKMQAGT